MSRYQIKAGLLREREYFDTERFADLFAFAADQMGNDGFNPENAVIAVTVGGPNLYVFNLTAALVLEAVSQGMEKGELVDWMVGVFDVDADMLDEDIDEIVQTMLSCGIICEIV